MDTDIAYTVVLNKPNAQGQCWRLVVASTSGGYSTLKETGADGDPFYVAKGPIWFDSRDEGKAEADRRNEQELGLSPQGAARIILESMAARTRSNVR